MLLKYGQSQGFTLRSLFSRRSKRERKSKRCSASFDEVNCPTSTLRARPRPNLPLKELEILGLMTDPRKESSPKSWYSSSDSDHRLDTPPETSNTPFLYPFAPLHDLHDYEHTSDSDHEQDTTSARRKQDSLPASPLLPPPPSFSLPPQQEASHVHGPSSPDPKEVDIGAPLSPSLSYRTFASSGIFPWGSAPHVVDDGLSDHVIVLPSPPRLPRSYGYRG